MHVPVDQRWLGMDKRGIPYALVAVALIIVLTRVVPAVDSAIAWNNPAKPGDVIDLGGGIRFTPPVGWQVENGSLVSRPGVTPVNSASASARVSDGTTHISVTNGNWDGSADELLDQADRIRTVSELDDDKAFRVTGDRTTFTTSSGIVGVSEPFTSTNGSGTVFAFAVRDSSDTPIGVVVTAVDSSDTPNVDRQQVLDAVSSLAISEAGS